ncbi:MAG: right-handed parallel beta-helix repeat-containing protein [Candidatus Binatia bacterium]
MVTLSSALWIITGAIQAAQASTVVVTPSNMNGWASFDDYGSGTGSFALVDGPGTAPLGRGSAQLTVDSIARWAVGTLAYAGTRLDQITALSYDAYRTSGSSPLAVSLQFDIDYGLGLTTYQGRLVFEPYLSGSPATGAWQSWDARAGTWYSSRAPYNAACSMASPCTWAQVLSNWPNAALRLPGVLLFKAGGPWTGGFDGNVDAFTITTTSGSTTYDFEPCVSAPEYVAPTASSDANNDCTDLATPCATIQHAIDAACPGGIVRVFPGTYSETATAPNPPACSGDTVGLYIGTSGITIQGVDSSGTAITDPNLVQATVNTNSNLCFGPDGIFVLGDNVTIAGIRVGTNTGGQNKTIEIGGNNFTLKNCDIADLQGSVYFNDYNFDTVNNVSHLQTYRIDGNIFEDGVSLDITNGAGFSGPVSGRVVTGNTFNNLATKASPDPSAEPWPSISFNGSGTGVGWFIYSVGGAVITGNTFNNTAPDGQQIRARGTYDNSQFVWASYFSTNTFNRSVVFGAAPSLDLGTFSYSPSPGVTFNNVRRIGVAIQGEIDHAQAGDTIDVGAGTYPEQVVVNKSLTLQGAGAGASIIQAPAVLAGDASGFMNIATITGGGVSAEISGFTVTGPGPGACGSINTGIFVRDGAIANIHDNTIANISDNPLSGCQNGQGIFVGRAAFSTTGTATITNNLITGYQKGGIVVDNTGSTATITGNTVTGVGATTQIAQNGIQVSRGAVATVSGNTVSGNLCNNSLCGPDLLNNDQSGGILLYQAGPATQVSSNTVSNNDVGIYNLADNSTISGNTLTSNRWEGIILDEGNATVTLNTIDGGNIGVAAVSFTGNTENSSGALSCNYITTVAAGTGIELLDQDTGDSYVPTVTAHLNAIDGTGAGLVNTTTTPVNAENNWWGCVGGPGNAGCNSVTGNVDFSNWATSVPSCVICEADADCSDGLVCNGTETCVGHKCQAGTPKDCSGTSDQCNLGVCTEPGTCVAQPLKDGTSCSGGACEAGVCTNLCAGVTCTSPDDCHTPGTCNPHTGQCSAPVTNGNGTSCSGGACESGVCTNLCAGVTCTSPDDCHTAGTCNSHTGVCSAPVTNGNGTSCSGGACEAGVCTNLCIGVTCQPLDQCHTPGTCNTHTGQCSSSPPKPDGSTCNDNNACTQTDTCQAGVCTGGNPVVCTADLCHNPGTCNTGTGVCSAPTSKGGACLLHDSVVLPLGPLTVTIPLHASAVTKKFGVWVRNATTRLGNATPQATLQLVASSVDCPAGTIVGLPDFGRWSAGTPDTIWLPGGYNGLATVSLNISSAAFTSFNRKAPTRCTLSFTVTTVLPVGAVDPTPENNTTTMELNVVNQNDPEQTTTHETLINSVAPLTVTLNRKTLSLSRTVGLSVVNADYKPKAETPGDTITVSVDRGNCPVGLFGTVDFKSGTQNSKTVKGGLTATGYLPLTINASAFSTLNALSPTRCTAILTATGPTTPDPDPTNNTTKLVIDVVDWNDF